MLLITIKYLSPLENPENLSFLGCPVKLLLRLLVDPALISKIEKGEFVDLEKLVPKDKRRRSDDNRLEWIHQDGGTFLAPVSDRANKITNFRRWEQAFRIYATIYCGANPNRSREIRQYVSVISTAASTFVWDNVYEYDVIFRHLMAFNPCRSWAVTYNQMWNICMRESLPNRNNFQQRPAPTTSGYKVRRKKKAKSPRSNSSESTTFLTKAMNRILDKLKYMQNRPSTTQNYVCAVP